MSTPSPVIDDGDDEKTKSLLETVGRHRRGLDKALESLERHLLKPSPTEKAPEKTTKPG